VNYLPPGAAAGFPSPKLTSPGTSGLGRQCPSPQGLLSNGTGVSAVHSGPLYSDARSPGDSLLNFSDNGSAAYDSSPRRDEN